MLVSRKIYSIFGNTNLEKYLLEGYRVEDIKLKTYSKYKSGHWTCHCENLTVVTSELAEFHALNEPILESIINRIIE
jgi:hypothetical protein